MKCSYFGVLFLCVFLICNVVNALEKKSRDAGKKYSFVKISTGSGVQIQKNIFKKFVGVEFKDSKGKTTARIEVSRSAFQVGDKKYVKGTDITKTKNHFLVTKYEREELSLDEYKKTGINEKMKNDVLVYNSDGKVIFEKKRVPYILAAISENGKVVACFNAGAEVLEDVDVDPGVKEKFPGTEFYVYSNSGTLLYKGVDRSTSMESIKFSPSGRLLVYGSFAPDANVKIIDLETKKRYFAAKDIRPNGYDGITDDGEIYVDQSEVLGKQADGIHWNYTWKKAILYKVVK